MLTRLSTFVYRRNLLASLLWLAALPLLLAGCAGQSTVDNLHETATLSNRQGLALLEQDAFVPAQAQFSDAIALLEQLLATCESTGDCGREKLAVIRENLALAYTNRAYTFMHLGGRDEQALADADRALALAPDLIQPHQYRAIIALRGLDEAAAWEEYLFLRERDPAFAEKLYEAFEEAFGPRVPVSPGGSQ